ncbi:MAG: DNA polymerase III subunit delta [bacterium]
MSYEDLLKDINKEKIASGYLFVGEEDNLKRDAIFRIKDKRKANLVVLDDEKNLREVLSNDMFGESKVVVLKEPSIKQRELIAKYIKNPSLSITIIISLKKVDSSYSIPVVNFPKLHFNNLKFWIRERFRENGRIIKASAIDLMLETIGEDTSFLMGEIEKITLYCSKKEISDCDIFPILSKGESKNIFFLLDAIGERKMSALSICNDLLSYGDSCNRILFMMEKRLREIFSIKDGIRDEAMKDWQYRKISNQARLFSKEEGCFIFSSLADCDLKLKSYSPGSREFILLSLIYRICSSNQRKAMEVNSFNAGSDKRKNEF